MAEGIITRRGGGVPIVLATGGTVTDITDGGVIYRTHTFTSSGTFGVTRGGQIEYLVVAGGGGSGSSGGSNRGGAGGAGGLLYGLTDVSAQSYSITVGDGGQGAITDSRAAENGTDSIFSLFTAIGGGAGSYFVAGWNPAQDGGSGGGSSGGDSTAGLGTAGQGNDGAGNTNGGGGGGAGSDGSSATGGSGQTVFGSLYAKGGDAQVSSISNANPNTGNGADAPDFNNSTGANGGSGIVIVRYRIG